MTGERINVAELANIVSSDIFKWFKWEKIGIMDENFSCHKVQKHKKGKVKPGTSHAHPVDVVFKYYDPYLDKQIYLNTDLKSYGRSSIKGTSIKKALASLAKTVDCAKSSQEWQSKYVLDNDSKEIRAMLFLYNHDDKYDDDFLSIIKGQNLSNLPIEEDDLLHLLDPSRIVYLYTVANDMKSLVGQGALRQNHDYSFVYPSLTLYKMHGDKKTHPATVETLCSPYMILHSEEVFGVDPTDHTKTISTDKGGYLIYYNRAGATVEEFMYLFDNLSKFQILSLTTPIKIRVAHRSPDSLILSNYKKAINMYVDDWGLDEYRLRDLNRINIEIIPTAIANFNPGIIAWKEEDK